MNSHLTRKIVLDWEKDHCQIKPLINVKISACFVTEIIIISPCFLYQKAVMTRSWIPPLAWRRGVFLMIVGWWIRRWRYDNSYDGELRRSKLATIHCISQELKTVLFLGKLYANLWSFQLVMKNDFAEYNDLLMQLKIKECFQHQHRCDMK